MTSSAGGRITPLPSNEFYQSPFDGRWVDVDEAEVFRLADMQRERIFGTRGKTVPGDGKCDRLQLKALNVFLAGEGIGLHIDTWNPKTGAITATIA